jgi:alpha-glucosidase
VSGKTFSFEGGKSKNRMKFKPTANHFVLIAVLVLTGISVSSCKETRDSIQIYSPDRHLSMRFRLKDGKALYDLNYNQRTLVKNSRLGFTFENLPPLDGDFEVVKTEELSVDETWMPSWDKNREIRNHHEALKVSLSEKKPLKRKVIIVFKLFNDGLGFRYEFPEQENLREFSIVDELTEFNMKGDFSAWSMKDEPNEGDKNIYKRNKLCEISDTVHTPLILESSRGVFVSIHEANLKTFASMTLYIDSSSRIRCGLFPGSRGSKVYGQSPFVTPWRSIQVAECPEDLLSSFLLLNLNVDEEAAELSWINSTKYIGICCLGK